MKLYGKKMVALVLTFAMALSMCSMNVFAANDPEEFDIEYTMAYTGSAYYDEVDLWTLLEEELSDYYEEDIVVDWFVIETDENDDVGLDYGSVALRGNNYGTYEIDLTEEAYDDLLEYGYLYENDIYYQAEDVDGWEYEGKIEIVIISDDYDFEYDLEGKTEFYLGQWIVNDLDEIMSETLDYVCLELDRDNECGTLYVDDYADEEFDDTQRYYFDENSRDYYDVEELYFVPNGAEGEFIIYYYAYGVNDEIIEGVITIYCDGGLLIEADMTSDDIYTFDSEVFQNAVDEWNDDYKLVYIDNVKLGNPEDGTLYYNYEEGSRRNAEISDKEEYYVSQTEDDVLDYISFVPQRDTTGVVNVYFDAFVEKRKGSDETLAGTLKINVSKAADITISAGEEDLVEIDYDVFQEYLEEVTDNDDYEVAYVTISGAPRTEQAGYLVCEEEDLTTRGDKTFYMDPSRTQYDLKELAFMGGSKKGTTSATFKVYYYKNATSNRVSSTDEGTINFVVGQTANVSNVMSGYCKASETMYFGADMTLDAFVAMGGNDNEYITFTTLPVGGKLIYNWGTPSQEDVTIGTEYYLNYVAGKKLMSNVTFVPSYSSSKAQKDIYIEIKGYDEKDKAIAGAINITVIYANISSYFSDITSNTYADSVDFLKNMGITEGVPGGKYDANGSLTRAQVVTFLYRAAGTPAVAGATTFKDVAKNDWYYDAVLWASQNGVTNGRSATIFDPNATVTNAEVIQFMYNFDVKYLKHSSYVAGSISSVADYANVGDWATTAVRWALGKGVLTPGYLYPTNVGTRGNIALYLHRMLTM